MINRRTGWEVLQAAVFALFLRELKTRFGKYHLGYLWAFLTPAAQAYGMVAVFEMLGRTEKEGISFPVFHVVAVITYYLFSYIALRSLHAIESNSGLFTYRLVKPIDTILTRTILESCIYGVVYCVLLGIIWLIGDRFDLSHGILIIAILSLVVALAFGLGLILMVLGHHFPELEKVISLLSLPMYVLSGVMFSFQSVPEQYLGYFTWNPLFHAVELERAALFPSYNNQPASLMYLTEVALTVLTIGLFTYKSFEKKMLQS